MKSVMKTLQQLLMKKKTIVNLKKALEWWKLKEVILKKIIWLKKVKEKALIKLLDKMHKYKTMLSFYLNFKKNTENINPNVLVKNQKLQKKNELKHH